MTEIRRVLLVVPIAPAAGGNGLAMRAGMLLDALAEEAEVNVVIVPVSGSADDLEWADARARSVHVVAPVRPESARQHVTAQLADARLRDRLERVAPVPARTAAAPPTLAGDVIDGLDPAAEPVAVLGMRAYLAPLASEVAHRLGAARLVIDLDDDDASLLRALGEGTEANKFDRLARAWLPEADAVLTASHGDADAVAERYDLGEVHAVPNAVRPPPAPAAPAAGTRLLFVGNLTYEPNIDAATVLVDEVLPAVQEHRPDATLELVGPSVQGTLDRLAAAPGVQVAGFVADLSSSYTRAAVVVIPLRHGGGTRIKVLEAFAYGRPVVATPAAVAGLDVRDGEDVMIAETPPAVAAAVVALLDDPARRRHRRSGPPHAHGQVRPRGRRPVAARCRPRLLATMSNERPKRAKGLDVHEVEDGLVVYQADRDRVHYLNQTSAVVFEFCTGKNTNDDIVGLVQAAWELTEPPRNEVMTCLLQLHAEGVVQ